MKRPRTYQAPIEIQLLRAVVYTVLVFAAMMILAVACAPVASAQGAPRLYLNDACSAAIDLEAGPSVFEQDGSLSVSVIEPIECETVIIDPPPDCGPPEGYRVLDEIEVELNNFPGPRGSTFEQLFGDFPGDGGFYRLQLNARDIASLPVTVPAVPEVTRLTFEGNVDVAAQTTVTLSRCAGGAFVPVSDTCSKTFGEAGANLIFGAAAVEQRCRVEPGTYHLVIIQAAEDGEPACGGDERCTVFFGLDVLVGGDP